MNVRPPRASSPTGSKYSGSLPQCSPTARTSASDEPTTLRGCAALDTANARPASIAKHAGTIDRRLTLASHAIATLRKGTHAAGKVHCQFSGLIHRSNWQRVASVIATHMQLQSVHRDAALAARTLRHLDADLGLDVARDQVPAR